MSKNTFFSDALIVENGIIQIGLLNQRNVGSAIIHSILKTLLNFQKYAQ